MDKRLIELTDSPLMALFRLSPATVRTSRLNVGYGTHEAWTTLIKDGILRLSCLVIASPTSYNNTTPSHNTDTSLVGWGIFMKTYIKNII
jgi:hypothetical protein